MKELVDEILERFPEIQDSVYEGDEELPYVMMSHVADWSAMKARENLDNHTIQRIVDFSKWCMSQPRGADAADDIYTMFVVSFLETLVEDVNLCKLVPKLIKKHDFIACREYYTTWCGKDACNRVLAEYEKQ